MKRYVHIVAAIPCVAFFFWVEPALAANPDTLASTTATSALADAGLRINELLASNRADIVDDEGQSSDWVEVHNSGTEAIRLGGYFLTDDVKILDKWAFPNNQVLAGGYHILWMSGQGRDTLSPEALRTSAATVPFEKTLIEASSVWKYLVSGASGEPNGGDENALSGWTAVDYDDGTFAVGQAGFGYGDEDDATEFPHGTTAVLLRREFTLTGPLTSESLVLQVDYDDGFAAYLNGTRIAAVNAPDEEPSLHSVASGSHDAGSPERFDLSAHVGLLRLGKNVLAIAGLNSHRSSSDMSVNPALGTLPPVCHANFRLNKDGGALYLVGPDGNIADQIEYPRQTSDQTLGRSASVDSNWGYFLTPSPGAANTGPQQPQPVKSRISFNPEPGAYKEGVRIQIDAKSSATVDIRFTTDGSKPVAASPKYLGPLTLDATTLFRAAGFVGAERVGRIVSATYLVGERPTLPVMSVSIQPTDFVDVHLQRTGGGRKGERPAFLEVFDSAGNRSVNTAFGFRLHGGAGRRGPIDKRKSYRAYFRKAYGDGRVDYSIIPEASVEDFDKLVLRSNSNDGHSHGSYIRDQLIRDLHRDMGALSSAGSWYVLLINSNSYGVYNVVERMDEEFFSSHLGPGDYDVIKTGNTVLNGTRQGWDDLREFISSRDFSDADNFEELSKRVDIENFTSYVILNLWCQNFDWPHNNWYAARRVPDGKWIFLCWDAEWGFNGGPSSGYLDNPYAFIDSGGAYGHGLSRMLFFALLGNPGYCEYYQQEVRRHLSEALSPDNALRHIRRHRDAIATDMEREFEARGYKKQRWHDRIAGIEDFARNCGEVFQQYTDEYFSYRAAPNEEDRVAVIEGTTGARHIFYRTANGHLRELFSADGSHWQDTAVTALGNPPLAAGRPTVYTLVPDAPRILYRGTSGHIHALSKHAVGGDVGQLVPRSWVHQDLTSHLRIPAASSDPSVVVVNDVPHIAYVDTSARAREIWFDGHWQQQPLPAAPRPAGELVISHSPAGLHVTYRTMFGAACEQTLRREAGGDGRRRWSPRLIHRLPAQGRPIGFDSGGKRNIIFRAAEKWPLDEPFVFLGPDYHGPDYSGPRNTLVQAWDAGDRFRRLEPIVEDPTNSITGNPCVVHDSTLDRHFLAYRDAEGHIREATRKQGKWQLADLTSLASAPPAAGEPNGLVSALTGSRYYVYRGLEGHLHELCFDGSWRHRDLSATATSN